MSNPERDEIPVLQRVSGLEYLGGRDVSNRAGLSLVALEQFARIYGRQVAWFMEDQQTSWQRLFETGDPLRVWMEHLDRRGGHIREGFEQGFAALRDISERDASLRRGLADAYDNVVDIHSESAADARESLHGEVLARLRRDHERLRQVLAVAQELIERIASLTPAELDRLVCCIDYIAEYPDMVHHPLEDRLFVHLLALDLSVEQREQVEGNAASHAELIAATQRLADDVNALLEDKSSVPADLGTHAQAFIELQRRHMAFEETYVFPLAEQRLATQPWQAQDAESDDPLFDQQLDQFEALYQHVSGRL